MPLRFVSSADKHHVPRRSTWYVVMTGKDEPTVTSWGEPGTLYVGTDDRGIELEVITVRRGRDDTAVHSMPSEDRHDKRN